jgi:hypothetical protein
VRDDRTVESCVIGSVLGNRTQKPAPLDRSRATDHGPHEEAHGRESEGVLERLERGAMMAVDTFPGAPCLHRPAVKCRRGAGRYAPGLVRTGLCDTVHVRSTAAAAAERWNGHVVKWDADVERRRFVIALELENSFDLLSPVSIRPLQILRSGFPLISVEQEPAPAVPVGAGLRSSSRDHSHTYLGSKP